MLSTIETVLRVLRQNWGVILTLLLVIAAFFIPTGKKVAEEQKKNQAILIGMCENVCTPFKVVEALEQECWCNQSIVRRTYGPKARTLSRKF